MIYKAWIILCIFLITSTNIALSQTKYNLICSLISEDTNQSKAITVKVDETIGKAIVDGHISFDVQHTEPKLQLILPAERAAQTFPANCQGNLCTGEIILIDRYTGEINWFSFVREDSRGECSPSDGERKF